MGLCGPRVPFTRDGEGGGDQICWSQQTFCARFTEIQFAGMGDSTQQTFEMSMYFMELAETPSNACLGWFFSHAL
jgi:hypothetical protein